MSSQRLSQRNRFRLYWLVVILQVVVVLTIVSWRVSILASGTPVLLGCSPVDPRSLFSGDYVILDYGIGEILDELFVTYPLPGETVYVALEKAPDSPYWQAVQAAKDPGDFNAGTQVFIRGTVGWHASTNSPPYRTIKYGLESYFVPQSEGQKIERSNRTNLHAEVAISKTGHAALKKLFVDGTEIKFR